MKLDDVIFIDNFPTLDLHGYDSATAVVAINDFVNDNYIMKKNIIVIIHGKGTGVLRKITNKVLKENKKVLDFKSYYYNSGCTIVEINTKK